MGGVASKAWALNRQQGIWLLAHETASGVFHFAAIHKNTAFFKYGK
jgi:hypothetical protein